MNLRKKEIEFSRHFVQSVDSCFQEFVTVSAVWIPVKVQICRLQYSKPDGIEVSMIKFDKQNNMRKFSQCKIIDSESSAAVYNLPISENI